MFRDYKKQQTGQKNKIMYIILEGGLSASHEKNVKAELMPHWELILTFLCMRIHGSGVRK